MRSIFTYILLSFLSVSAIAQSDTGQKINLHFQATYVYQYKPTFRSMYEGPNSLTSKEEKQNSVTATLFLGIKLWKGGEIYINPEIAAGSGLSGAFGLAASTNGETFRVGNPAPTLYLARGFLKQTFALGRSKDQTRDVNSLDDQANQLNGVEPQNFLRFTIGKYCLGDLFDNNNYSGSPRLQSMNWALMNNAAWDYAANVRGYTYAFTTMLQYKRMSYKAAIATLPLVANGPELNTDLGQAYALNAEVVETHEIKGHPGHVRVLPYYNKANMDNYKQALQTPDSINIPDVTTTRSFNNTKTGIGINIDQEVEDNVGLFLRFGLNDGQTETWCYTEADRTLSMGMLLTGSEWRRTADNIGVAFVFNNLSADHKNYLKAGGMGFQLGDGQLAYGTEIAAEVFYSYKLANKGLWLTGDYQFVMNPGYNKDRGPVNVFSFRLHVEL